MNSQRTRKKTVALIITAMLLISPALAVGSSAAVAATPAKAKHLSLSDVMMQGTTSGINLPMWVASSEGYFAKQGVNVTVVTSSLSSAALVSVLLSGTWQFLTSVPSALVLAAQQGAPVRAVAQLETSTAQVLAINQSFATAHNIPSTGTTPKTALAQLLALHGSHATIAVSNTASDSYNWLVGLLKLNSMTVGPTGDVNVVSSGTVPTLVTGLVSGKYDGIVNSPPTTLQPNTIQVPLYLLKPASLVGGAYLVTTTSMIQQHPDTVQAVVTAEMQAREFILTHKAKALKDALTWFTSPTVGLTSEVGTLLFSSGYRQFDVRPFYPSKTAYNYELKLINLAQASPLTVNFSNFVYTKFAKQALKELNLN